MSESESKSLREFRKRQLPATLRELADCMDSVATDMDYFGGFSAIGRHGRELASAAAIARAWADGIERELQETP